MSDDHPGRAPRAILVGLVAPFLVTLALLAASWELVGMRQGWRSMRDGFVEGLKLARAPSDTGSVPTVVEDRALGYALSRPQGYRLVVARGGAFAYREATPGKEELGSTAALVVPSVIPDPAPAPRLLRTMLSELPEVLSGPGQRAAYPITPGTIHHEGPHTWSIFDTRFGSTSVHGEAHVHVDGPRVTFAAFWSTKDSYDKERHDLHAFIEGYRRRPAAAVRGHVGEVLSIGVPPGFDVEESVGQVRVAARDDRDVSVTVTFLRRDARVKAPEAILSSFAAGGQGVTSGEVTALTTYPSVDGAPGVTWLASGGLLAYRQKGRYLRAVGTGLVARWPTGHAYLRSIRQAPSERFEAVQPLLAAIEGTCRFARAIGGIGGVRWPVGQPHDASPLAATFARWRMRRGLPSDWGHDTLLAYDERLSARTGETWFCPVALRQPDGGHVNPEDPGELLALP